MCMYINELCHVCEGSCAHKTWAHKTCLMCRLMSHKTWAHKTHTYDIHKTWAHEHSHACSCLMSHVNIGNYPFRHAHGNYPFRHVLMSYVTRKHRQLPISPRACLCVTWRIHMRGITHLHAYTQKTANLLHLFCLITTTPFFKQSIWLSWKQVQGGVVS